MKNRDLIFGDMAKERPKCREGIVKSALRPNPDVENWNGETALDPNGREIFLSPGVSMRRIRIGGRDLALLMHRFLHRVLRVQLHQILPHCVVDLGCFHQLLPRNTALFRRIRFHETAIYRQVLPLH